ncbi:MAG: sporulation protein YqfD [Lachnospiraceae bacterium]
MNKIMSYLEGAVEVQLQSSTPERFLNICNSNQMQIYQVAKQGEYYIFYISVRDFLQLKPILKKTASKVRVIRKIGIGFWIFKHRKHYCFAAGIMLAVLLLYILSLFLWDIQIDGNYMLSEEVIIDSLKNQGYSHGMWIRPISCDKVEKILRSEFEELTWVSVELTGTRMIIHVKENDEDYVEVRSTGEGNLCATKDGVVYSIVTRSGTPLVKEGAKVKTGDVLVQGEVAVYDDYGNVIDSSKITPDADIFLLTENSYENSIKKLYKYKIYTGNYRSVYFLSVGEYLFKFGLLAKYDQYEVISTDQQLRLNSSFYLPIHYGTLNYNEYMEENATYSKEEAQELLEIQFQYFLEGLKEKGVQILEKDVKMYEDGNSYVYRGRITMIEPAVQLSELSEMNLGELNECN